MTLQQDLPPEQTGAFHRALLRYIEEEAPYVRLEIEQTGELSEELKKNIVNLAKDFLKRYREKMPR